MFKISPLALRLFELRGLIRRHRAGNMRLFSWFDCERIALLVKARKAGLAVREFAAVLRAMDEQASDKVAEAGRLQCLSVIHTLEIHKQSVSNLLEELYRIDWELSERLGVEGCLENGESVVVDTSSARVRAHYKKQMSAQREAQVKLFRKFGLDHVVVRTDQPYVRPIRDLFARRARRSRR